MARCREVLPLCEQIVRFRIGIGELLAFHSAVCEKAEMHNLSRESAAYRVIEDIRDYVKLYEKATIRLSHADICDESIFGAPK